MEVLEAPSRFAEQLRAHRWTELISTHRLVDRSRVSAAMICQIENGRSMTTLPTAERIAAGCGASLADFLQRDAGAEPHLPESFEREDFGSVSGGERSCEAVLG
jgi:transcriptional regulator with XRE-family HTH domain